MFGNVVLEAFLFAAAIVGGGAYFFRSAIVSALGVG